MVEYLRRSREGVRSTMPAAFFFARWNLDPRLDRLQEILSRYIGQSNAPDCFICFIHMTADQR